jgi:hypothetical protein
VRRAREAGRGLLAAQGLLAVLCLLFGVLPTTTVAALGRVTDSLTGHAVAAATRQGWLWLTPVSPAAASYSAPLVLLGVAMALGVWGAVWLILRQRSQATPRTLAWECGFGALGSRMQYTATAFAMPIRQIFSPVWRLHEERVREMDPLLTTRPLRLGYHLHVEDLCWNALYRPLERLLHAAARRVGRIQTGQLRHYLAYSFLTLVVLLWLIT